MWKPWFWSLPSLLVLLGVGACEMPWAGSEREIYIGQFPSKDAGIRAAIKRLAVEAEKHPNKVIIRVEWTGPYSDETESERQAIDRRALQYGGEGSVKGLGYATDISSGSTPPCYYVDLAAIKAVAERGGTLEDFEEYALRSDVQFEIGGFSSKDAGVRAAIKELARETAPTCYVRSYRVVWVGPLSDDAGGARQSIGKQALFYCGAGDVRALGYEPDASKGISGRAYFVDRPAIRAVAEQHGTLEDFAEFDKNNSQGQNAGASSCIR